MIKVEFTPSEYVSQDEVVMALKAINEALENYSLESRITESSLYGFHSEDPDIGYVIHGSPSYDPGNLDGIDKLVVYFPDDLIEEIEQSVPKSKYNNRIREIASEMGILVVEIFELPFFEEIDLIISIDTSRYLKIWKEKQKEAKLSAKRRELSRRKSSLKRKKKKMRYR